MTSDMNELDMTELDLRELMDAETVLTAMECLELHLVDRIIGQSQEEDPGEPLRMVAACYNNTVKAMRTLPEIGPLKEKREAMLREMAGQLETEKARYRVET